MSFVFRKPQNSVVKLILRKRECDWWKIRNGKRIEVELEIYVLKYYYSILNSIILKL